MAWHKAKKGGNVFLFLLLLFNNHFDFLLNHFFLFLPVIFLFNFPPSKPSSLLCRLLFLSDSYFYFSFIFILSNFDQLKQKLSNKKISPLHLSSAFFSFFFLQPFPAMVSFQSNIFILFFFFLLVFLFPCLAFYSKILFSFSSLLRILTLTFILLFLVINFLSPSFRTPFNANKTLSLHGKVWRWRSTKQFSIPYIFCCPIGQMLAPDSIFDSSDADLAAPK